MKNKVKKSSVSFPLALPPPTKGELMTKLTKVQKRDIRALSAKRDEDIDFSDAAPVVDWSKAEMGKFYRPRKKPVTMRLDSDVIDWLKAEGRGYQTKANWLLRHAMLHFTKTSTRQIRRRAARKRK
jgi:uncharacterized protein (DUF4415 family)